MGLLLRPDAYLAESEDGAYLLTHEGPVVFTGRSVHRLIERLTPHLDGRHTLAELTADLAEDRREAVTRLVGLLLERGVVREVTAPPESGTTYLGYFHDAPDRALARYRGLRTLVAGDGPLAAAVVTAARRSGLRDVTAESGVDSTVDGADVDLVFQVATGFEQADAAERAHRGWLGQAVLWGEQAWLGVREPSGGASWGSVGRRLRAWHEDAPGAAVPAGAAATVVANRLVHSVFRAVTGIEPPRPGHVVAVDLSTLADERHRVVPHPLAGPVAASAAAGGAELDEEEFSRAAVACADDRTGLFGEPTEGDLAQLPLHVCRITVSDPVGLLADGPLPVVTGAGLDFRTARHRAAVRAFARYASLAVDPRRLAGGVVTGYTLDTRTPVPVPAAVAFPPRADAGTAAGVAAGYTWDEAVEHALMAHCRQLTAAELSTADTEPLLVEPPDGRYRGILDAIGLPLSVHDITGSLGVPTYLACLDDRPAGCASRLDGADALTDTLEQAVLHYQARVNDQPLYAPPEAPALRWSPRTDPVPAPHRSADLPGAVAALTARGLRPVAVPLDHDPEATGTMPNSVRVVLLDD
jgi:hypothetical protein